MKPKRSKLTISDVTIDKVKYSRFGCRNCLYQSCECTDAVRFVPALNRLTNEPTCGNDAYYD